MRTSKTRSTEINVHVYIAHTEHYLTVDLPLYEGEQVMHLSLLVPGLLSFSPILR